MRELLLPASILPAALAAVTTEEVALYERLLEKWGIGLIGLVLFAALSWITYKREEKREAERDKQTAAATKERNGLQARNLELTEQLLKVQQDHSRIVEQLHRDGNKAHADHAREIRNLVRKLRCCQLNLREDRNQCQLNFDNTQDE